MSESEFPASIMNVLDIEGNVLYHEFYLDDTIRLHPIWPPMVSVS